jgi:hypothetical protein
MDAREGERERERGGDEMKTMIRASATPDVVRRSRAGARLSPETNDALLFIARA